MVENYKIFPLRASSGIKLDGTQEEGNYWNKGLWTRFYRGLPRSILGYRSMTESFMALLAGFLSILMVRDSLIYLMERQTI